MSSESANRKAAFSASSPRRGRPRSDAVRMAILRAAQELLQESGLHEFTIEGVAARSGAAKTTIYRWWPSKGALATESFLLVMAPRLAYPNTGSARENIRRQLHLVAAAFRGKAGLTMCGLIAEAQMDPESAKALLEKYFRPRRAEATRFIHQGIVDGEFREDIDVNATIDALYGPIYYRLLIKHGEIHGQFVDTVFDIAMRGVETTASTSRPRVKPGRSKAPAK